MDQRRCDGVLDMGEKNETPTRIKAAIEKAQVRSNSYCSFEMEW